jgi:hypothetical protein
MHRNISISANLIFFNRDNIYDGPHAQHTARRQETEDDVI